ncbi:dihydrofolate reductase family protein [Actinophytocola oryzae]|uniref:Dihydrofolate reductase n=1 Tax=Actinophytocola oryzae TaxID=502181 RepID=A0A4R7UW94_9PSEU|nr:dihydrofolate reductase family protein [Actinophytocola oryzae]TDV41053.1 dihydrofolate reductase [Actinophytocola oryzae]
MGKVVIDISVSLDGYISGPNDRPDEGLGDGGDRLHNWVWNGEIAESDSTLMTESLAAVGALVCGRRTYDNSKPYWGVGKGPHGDVPVFVVSHGVDEDGVGDHTPFTWVGDIQTAYEQAVKAAGERDVRVMGGASVPQQFLAAGLVDEVTIHLVPAFLGGGQRLFDNLGPDVVLEQTAVVSSPALTHLTYRTVR